MRNAIKNLLQFKYHVVSWVALAVVHHCGMDLDSQIDGGMMAFVDSKRISCENNPCSFAFHSDNRGTLSYLK